jgi:hypothetical protein
MRENKINLNNTIYIAGIIAFLCVIAFFIWWKKSIEVINNPQPLPVSSISGLSCEKFDQRPVSVMLASDPITRPLSGISKADMIFEMPVTPSGVTRIMAVFQCNEPTEIGSIRSARQGFIPLAAGINSIYAHWGGERDALSRLNNGIMDNVDALKYEGTIFYRKNGVQPPHDGFAALEKIKIQAEKLGYGLDDVFTGYEHTDKKPEVRNISNIATTVAVDYPYPYNITWKYDENTNTYKRSRGDEVEIDKEDDSIVHASVVIVMETKAQFMYDQYVDVMVTGQGGATVYQNGIAITASWKKDKELDSKLYFYDNDGQEIEFVPGQIWIEIITSL